MDRPENSSRERRENFRVKDLALVASRPLTPAQAKQWRHEEHSAVTDAFELASWFGELRQKTTLLHRQAQQESPRLADYVDTLDQKLDRLMQVLLIRDMDLQEHSPQEVDIGAEGLGFTGTSGVEEGQQLELHVLLLSTGTGLRLLGTVVRCQPLPEGEAGYDIAVTLEYQREADRELLLHHLLHRQSELIRERNQTGMPEG